MMVLLRACLCVVLVLAASAPVLAGAWTKPQGTGEVILTLRNTDADHRFEQGGDAIRAPRFTKTEISVYAEYGLRDSTTLVFQPEVRRKSVGSAPGETVSGLGRVDVGVRKRVWQGDSGVASLQGSVRIPGSSDALKPANGGDTEFEIDGRVLYGRGIRAFARNGFVDAQLGYRHRFGAPADELRLDLTAGIDLYSDVMLLTQSFNSLSVGSVSAPFERIREHKISATTVYRYGENWSIQAGVVATVAGSNVLAERGFIFSIWRSF